MSPATTPATAPATTPATPGISASRGVVFDLDGTLVESWGVHLRCLRRAAEAVGAGRLGAARIAASQRAVDLETLVALVGAEQLEPAMQAYRTALRSELATSAVLARPHARNVLEQLRGEGVTVGVCTGRSRLDARALLDASGLDVDLTVAREDAARPKPNPDGLLLAVRRLGLRPRDTTYVGDSCFDAEQGRAAGVHTLIVGSASHAPDARALPDLGHLLEAIHEVGHHG